MSEDIQDYDDDEIAPASTDAVSTSSASPIPPDKAPSPLNPMVSNYLQNKQAMAAAQEKSNTNQLIAGLTRASGTLAHSAYGATNPIDEKAYEALDASAQTPIQQEQAREAQQGKDPNSPLAKQLREIYKPIFKSSGIDPSSLDGLGADEIKAYAQNPLEFEEKMRTSTANRALAVSASNQARQDKLDKSADDKQIAAYNATIQQLETMRSNKAAGTAESDIYAASKVKSLYKLYGDPNNLNPAMVKLLVSEVGKIAANGQATEAELNYMTPATLRGKLAGVWEKLSNDPSPANAGAFLKQYQDYANTLSKDAQKTIEDRYGRIIDSKSDEFTPRQVKHLKDIYVNRFSAEREGDTTPPTEETVNIIDPTGKVRSVPKSQQAAALKAGGRLAGAP